MAAITSLASGNWSSTATWVGGVVPVDGDTAVIAAGHSVVVDVNSTIGTAGATGTEALLVSSTATLTINAGITLTAKGDVNLQRGSSYTQNGHLSFVVATGVIYYLKNTTAGAGFCTVLINGPASTNRATISKTGLGVAAINFSGAATYLYTRLTFTNLTCFDLGASTVTYAFQHYTFAAANYQYGTNVAFIRCGSVRIAANHADAIFDWNNLLISKPITTTDVLYLSGPAAKGTPGVRRIRNLFIYSEADSAFYNLAADLTIEKWIVVNCNPVVTASTLRNTQTEVLCINDTITPTGKSLWHTIAKSSNTYSKTMFLAHCANQHYCGGSTGGTGVSNIWTNIVFDGDNYTYYDAGDCFMNSEKIECYNILAINKAGTLFSGLQAAASFYIKNFTCYNAYHGAMGENNGNATQLELLANGLIVNQDMGVMQLAAFAPMQDTAYIDYIGFTGLTGTRINDPVLGVPGYMGAETFGSWFVTGSFDGREGRGAHSKNADPQFRDPSRTIRTWVGSVIGSDTSNTNTWTTTLMGAELIKNSGLDKDGVYATAYANSMPNDCFTYLEYGFTPTNSVYKGTGLGGLDYGAFAVVVSGGGGGEISGNEASTDGFVLGFRSVMLKSILATFFKPVFSGIAAAFRPANSLTYSDFSSGLSGADGAFAYTLAGSQYENGVLVGLQPACDDLAFAGLPGVRGMRTMGQATNLVPNSEAVGAAVGVAPTGWGGFGTSNGITVASVGAGKGYVDIRISGMATATYYPVANFTQTSHNINAIVGDIFTASAKVTLLSGTWSANSPRLDVAEYSSANGWLASSDTPLAGFSGVEKSHTRTFTNAAVAKVKTAIVFSVPNGTTIDFTVRIERPQLTKTAYPVLYIPTYGTAVTQTSTAHNGTSGIHYNMPQNGAVWNQFSTAKPLTLAARIVTGVGSAELPNSTTLGVFTSKGVDIADLFLMKDSAGTANARSADGTSIADISPFPWSRYEQLVLVMQVNTAGTQFRVGVYRVAAKTWSWSAWTAYDGSFNPSATYQKLMLAFGNNYPMWHIRHWLADYQATEADITSAMGVE